MEVLGVGFHPAKQLPAGLIDALWKGREQRSQSPLPPQVRRWGCSGRLRSAQLIPLPPSPTPCPQTTVGLGRAQQQHRHCEAEKAAAAAF